MSSALVDENNENNMVMEIPSEVAMRCMRKRGSYYIP
jgi:hypothetical protein